MSADEQPAPATACDAPSPSVYVHSYDGFGAPIYRCNCLVCGRCNKHTGNSNQGHYWSWCKVTRSLREFHFCCPGNCELEARRRAIEAGEEPAETQGLIGYFPDPEPAPAGDGPVIEIPTVEQPAPLESGGVLADANSSSPASAPLSTGVSEVVSTPAPAAVSEPAGGGGGWGGGDGGSGGSDGGGGGGCD